MKKTILNIFIFFIALSTFFSLSKINVYADDVPSTGADSVTLIDATTGTILYNKNSDTAYPPASTTKLMTALLTLENCNLDDKVTVGKNPPYIEGSKIGIMDGEVLTVRDLLHGLLLMSGNDCAVALAEYVGKGSLDNFVNMMNAKAKELGCTDSHFKNPSGLYDKEHVMSSHDLAYIMRELTKNQNFIKIATTENYKISPTNKHSSGINLSTENKLVEKHSKYYYKGIEGGKTGYTIDSLHSYVASASRNGQRLIVAMVHSKDNNLFYDATEMLNYGFNNFKLVKLYENGNVAATYTKGKVSIPLTCSEDFYYVRNVKDSAPEPTMVLDNVNLADKSFKKGQTILKGNVYYKDNFVGTVKLNSMVDHIIKDNNLPFFKSINKKAVYTASFVGLTLLLIAGYVVKIKFIDKNNLDPKNTFLFRR